MLQVHPVHPGERCELGGYPAELGTAGEANRVEYYLRRSSMRLLSWLLPRGDFARSVSILTAGTAAAQALVALTSPLIARLYTPSDMGIFAVFGGIVGVCGGLACLRYDVAIPQPRSSELAVNVLALSLAILAATGLVATFVVALARRVIADLLGVPGIAPYLWLMPLGMVMIGAYNAFNSWFIREGEFTTMARTKFIQSSTQLGIQLGGGVLAASPWGLCAAFVMGRSVGVGAFFRRFIGAHRSLLRCVKVGTVIDVARRYWRFPLISSWSATINAAGMNAPALMLAALYGPEVAGWYTVAEMFIGLPLGMVSGAVEQVYWGETARIVHVDSASLPRRFKALSLRLVVTLLPMGLVGAVLSLWIVPILFGVSWRNAGIYAAILAVRTCAGGISSATSTLLLFGYNAWMSGWEILRLLTVIASIWFCEQAGLPPVVAIVSLAVTSASAHVLLYVLNWIAVNRVATGGPQWA